MDDYRLACTAGFCQQALELTKLTVSGKWYCLGPGGTLVASTLEGDTEEALSKSESTQKTRQHARGPTALGQRRCKRRPTQPYTKGSHVAREPLRKLCIAGKSAGGLSCMVHKELCGRIPASLGNCKTRGAQGYCLAWGVKLLPPPKLDSRMSGPLQSTTCEAESTHFVRRGDPSHRSSLQRGAC
ncbi:hypothetical protein NDU88_002738 [Pleurodeles waltl]|uniref:Uncharacterized protein n=1 Tax=Pleurodeles waltl TaxID=8319 RepID=A0AAV7NHD2_PLEWA|nr:hypothetical protein NDU88_002738 [Pleurodeles waltl]